MLASYLESFDVLAAQYAKPQGRIISVDDKSLGALLEQPNNVFFLLVGVVLVVLVLLFLLIFFMIRIARKMYKKMKEEGDL